MPTPKKSPEEIPWVGSTPQKPGIFAPISPQGDGPAPYRNVQTQDNAWALHASEQEALGLKETERAELILSLMRTLGVLGAEIEDEEVFGREAELENGNVEPMLHEEFARRVREKHGR